MRKLLTTLFATALLAVVFVPTANAQTGSTRPIDKSTYLTFSAPVSLPTVSLPAGTYVFRFVDPVNAPGLLEVRSKDEKTVYALINTIPITRTEPQSGTSEIVTFRETPVNVPVGINAWFFNATETTPGSEDVGCELIYTK